MNREECFNQLRESVAEGVRAHRQIGGVFFVDSLPELKRKIDLIEQKWSPQALENMETAIDRKNHWTKRVSSFLRAENEAGRKAKIIKDFALIFLPYGKQISSVSEFLREAVLPDTKLEQTQHPTMKVIQWLTERLAEKSTKTGLIILVSVLAFFGIETDVVTLTENLEALIQAGAGVIVAATALYEMFRKEKPEPQV